MVPKIGQASGECSNCGRVLNRERPAESAYCDCWEYCPRDHGKGRYSTKMDPYVPDLESIKHYKELENISEVQSGDLENPINILRVCPECGYHSSLKPVEVKLE